MPIESIGITIVIFGAFLYSVVLHEVAHGYMAEQFGDKTARFAGRLTLNPLPHLDPIGSFLLPLMLFISGAPVFGYARPVPYNPNMMRNRRSDPLKVMAAGPATNIAIAVVLGLVLRVLLAAGLAHPVMLQILSTVVFLNLVLAVFNLIPVPPFDGRFLIGLINPVWMLRAEIVMARMGGMGWIVGLFIGLFIVFPIVLPLIPLAFRLITGVSF